MTHRAKHVIDSSVHDSQHIAVKHWVDHNSFHDTRRELESYLSSYQLNHEHSGLDLALTGRRHLVVTQD